MYSKQQEFSGLPSITFCNCSWFSCKVIGNVGVSCLITFLKLYSTVPVTVHIASLFLKKLLFFFRQSNQMDIGLMQFIFISRKGDKSSWCISYIFLEKSVASFKGFSMTSLQTTLPFLHFPQTMHLSQALYPVCPTIFFINAVTGASHRKLPIEISTFPPSFSIPPLMAFHSSMKSFKN